MNTAKDDDWDIVIKPKEKGIHLHLKEVWRYKDLLYLYVKRDFISTYKQTILGPLWFFIQPIFSTLIFTLVFGGIAQISTDGLPPMLFYMAGVLCWNYFTDCLSRSSGTFMGNAGVFSKVYFPRLVVPIAGLVSAVLKMFIQLLLFFSIYIYFLFQGSPIGVNSYVLLFPLLITMMAGIGFGIGIIISSVTIKYRDLNILFSFAIGLMMYITPVIYPLSAIPAKYGALKWVIQLNPLSSIFEAFRFGMLGTGNLSWGGLLYSSIFTVVVVLIGIVTFNKVERRFVDIV
ncbi:MULTISPECIES: ABC transporter permease [unclassified Dysgonomonas]|uniref:ABC transporter permease n=1 Tax=unclassified Dysgonomonas TaxID=2630389 RepID=UPI000682AD6F|nr:MULTISPECIES: ABC transporter permease [unclassified Dysgonomonas]MBD8348139.1 ABC transporter permease [Dysgonomonas sp. HGC4]MBF0575887.1 ABC transporter permease [Dysgonomonas sp. GY617]